MKDDRNDKLWRYYLSGKIEEWVLDIAVTVMAIYCVVHVAYGLIDQYLMTH